MIGPKAMAESRLGLHVGNGKTLYAVAVEVGYARRPDFVYFGAKTIEDVRAGLVSLSLPKGSRVVGVAPAIGFFHDERGEELVA